MFLCGEKGFLYKLPQTNDRFKQITTVKIQGEHQTIEMTWGEASTTPAESKKTSLTTKSLFRPHVH